ncbi:PREDICTED: uncharacterized protein LOC106101229 [Papilio polytes]|uniref:uncharacterized protein LOC106101229 n=1 Tax=Papilio polytes TaxID=76194 RepID=UPI0006767744|nr:PREDICTED: uncharacterized protein LOC106101229 [Papilio polytes]
MQYMIEMCTETWRGAGVARSPSHESVTTDLSLFSVSSAASDARVLRMLACKAGQGPDPSIRVASPNPDGKARSTALPLSSGESGDACREVLAGCAALCAQLGLRRSFSAADVCQQHAAPPPRSATSEVGLCAALEALTMNAASRSCSTWVAGKLQLAVLIRLYSHKHVRQNYIKKRLLTTYRALERMSQSEFNLDRLEQAAAASTGRGNCLAPPPNTRLLHPETAHLVLTAADLERERGRPLSKYERNMMIFNWLHTLDEGAPY